MESIPTNPEDAWPILEKLIECRNCTFFSVNLFEMTCQNPEGESFTLGTDTSTCECFYARSQKIKNWLEEFENRMVENLKFDYALQL